eukprot:COSAG02_NODE_13656_length_1364_cov_1.771113_1_plen_185_part_10
MLKYHQTQRRQAQLADATTQGAGEGIDDSGAGPLERMARQERQQGGGGRARDARAHPYPTTTQGLNYDSRSRRRGLQNTVVLGSRGRRDAVRAPNFCVQQTEIAEPAGRPVQTHFCTAQRYSTCIIGKSDDLCTPTSESHCDGPGADDGGGGVSGSLARISARCRWPRTQCAVGGHARSALGKKR